MNLRRIRLPKLLSPLYYLMIFHERKSHYDLTVPAIFAVLTTAAFVLLPVSPRLLGEQGVLKEFQTLLSFLAAFFLAALAAVATFNKPSLDTLMAGEPPTLWVQRSGYFVLARLTRRQFVCYLFGYLSFVSMALFLIIAGLNAARPSIWLIPQSDWYTWSKAAMVCLGSFVLWNMICTTLLGLYYLSERIHREADQPKENGDRKAA